MVVRWMVVDGNSWEVLAGLADDAAIGEDGAHGIFQG